MSKLPYIRLYINDFIADTLHLDGDQGWAYLLLLLHYWKHRQGPTSCEQITQRIGRWPSHRSADDWEPVMDFFEVRDSRLFHSRLEEELQSCEQSHDAAVAKGLKGSAKRWGTHSTNNSANSPRYSKSKFRPQKSEVNNSEVISQRKGSNKLATAAPSEFSLTPKMKKWAEPLGFSSATLYGETEIFLDYHRARGSEFIDWMAAWRNWIKKAQKFKEES